jgi:hypothetical protein
MGSIRDHFVTAEAMSVMNGSRGIADERPVQDISVATYPRQSTQEDDTGSK